MKTTVKIPILSHFYTEESTKSTVFGGRKITATNAETLVIYRRILLFSGVFDNSERLRVTRGYRLLFVYVLYLPSVFFRNTYGIEILILIFLFFFLCCCCLIFAIIFVLFNSFEFRQDTIDNSIP